MRQMRWNPLRWALPVLAMVAGAVTPGIAATSGEHITLRNGFEMDCTAREVVGDRVRLYTGAGKVDYLEVRPEAIVTAEALPVTEAATPATLPPVGGVLSGSAALSGSVALGSSAVGQGAGASVMDVHALADRAGRSHNIDADLLRSIIRAESGGNARAVSRAGARGLMQLMPATATAMGVADSFAPEQNVAGGAAYLDRLLTMYHDDIVLAVAAYNAGPAAVARWHGVPPYRETREYVARVVREFNRRKLVAMK